ncbi:sensor histidine kinase [Pseudomonas sp. NPDC078700]|uniref:sensor histidine kinase n=1 Tax=Pseudomonas sp. NPDC078700 TaxID=3364424 RepID=UPI0037CBB592
MRSTYPLFWRLAAQLLGLCIVIAWGAWYWSGVIEQRTAYLSKAAQQQLHAYAHEAEQAWIQKGAEGVDQWVARMAEREPEIWVAVVGRSQASMSSQPLSAEEFTHLRRLRSVDGPMSKRVSGLPFIGVPFVQAVDQGQVIIQLPRRFVPEGFTWSMQVMLQGVVPAVLALLLCLLIYRQVIAPLGYLLEQVNALGGDNLGARVSPKLSQRQDELGRLGRAFDRMAERLDKTVSLQRQLLRDVSHELRTPLARLRVAGECAADAPELRLRLEREVNSMQVLVDDTLELVWLDTERPQLDLQDIDVAALWGVICEDACFESSWQPNRLRCELPHNCHVRGHLNSLAQALENIVRNAIRHSPAEGCVVLSGQPQADGWLLTIEDQGGGVDESQLERIFQPFTRLSAARPGGEGFGLGLAIAKGAVQLQGGQLWADNGDTGLRLWLRLQSV